MRNIITVLFSILVSKLANWAQPTGENLSYKLIEKVTDKLLENLRKVTMLIITCLVCASLLVAGIIVSGMNLFSNYDQTGSFRFTGVLSFSLALIFISSAVLLLVLNKKTWSSVKSMSTEASRNQSQSYDSNSHFNLYSKSEPSPIETAISQLIMDFIKEREKAREKAREKTRDKDKEEFKKEKEHEDHKRKTASSQS